MLDIIAYTLFAAGCIYGGRKLYGGWAAPICLAIVSPIAFGIVGGLISLFELSVLGAILKTLGLPIPDPDEYWTNGLLKIGASIVATVGLLYIASKEGVARKVDALREPFPPDP